MESYSCLIILLQLEGLIGLSFAAVISTGLTSGTWIAEGEVPIGGAVFSEDDAAILYLRRFLCNWSARIMQHNSSRSRFSSSFHLHELQTLLLHFFVHNLYTSTHRIYHNLLVSHRKTFKLVLLIHFLRHFPAYVPTFFAPLGISTLMSLDYYSSFSWPPEEGFLLSTSSCTPFMFLESWALDVGSFIPFADSVDIGWCPTLLYDVFVTQSI